jgi:CHAT domain-containing protein
VLYPRIVISYISLLSLISLISFSSPDNHVIRTTTHFDNIYLAEKSVRENIRTEVSLKTLNQKLLFLLQKGDTDSSRKMVDSLLFIIEGGVTADSSDIGDSYYYSGFYYLKFYDSSVALPYLLKAKEIYERTGRKSQEIFPKFLNNLGLAYLNIGDYNQSIYYIGYSIEAAKKIYGSKSLNLIDGYMGISVNHIFMRNFEKAIECMNYALNIVQMHPDSISRETLASLYGNKGVAYAYLANYDQAKINLEKAESYYDGQKNTDLYRYANLLDNLGTVNHFKGLKEKTYYYYEKGLKLFTDDPSPEGFFLANNYAIILANDSMEKKGELLLSDFLRRAQQSPKYDRRKYYQILNSYADYLREYDLDNALATRLYLQCFEFINDHPWDKDFRDNTILGFSLALFKNGEYLVALDSVQTLLFPGSLSAYNTDILINPAPDSVKSDGRTIKILNTKFRILWSEYLINSDIRLLEAAAGTSELVITVLEKIRLKIGEEGSRLLLGDKYRNSYMDAIMCLNECYSKTNKLEYLEKAFEYSEKSKVASLLASTREMKAIQDHIPAELAEKEKELQRTIGFYGSKIIEVENSEKPDNSKIALWNDYILKAQQERDSIIKVFESNYPEYYALKYSTKVITLQQIPGVIGKKNNYLSYIVSDTILYTIVSNSRNRQLITQKINSSFFDIIREYRKILISPDLDEKSKDEFTRFQVCGSKLYSYLIEPVKKYLISDNLIISPDNIISYIPFETFITVDKTRDDLLYRKLDYMMNDFSISYAYSATLLAENRKSSRSWRNSALIFAPSYGSGISIDSISNERQSSGGFLRALPNARNEAEFVAGITHGSLYTDSDAKESVYKELAGSYDVIHLAMHTLINNQNPIISKMIFAVSEDTLSDIGLNVFEVYGIPLKAKMVVLSSCNTGSGNLLRGEGILSLARGFIYSGSRSVVMSLWEVDDRSGTDIVKSFYRYLKKGESKSESLKKARLKYLKSADQLRAHPYFWSQLVVYGDDSPLYYPPYLKLIFLLIPCVLIFGVYIYFKKR